MKMKTSEGVSQDTMPRPSQAHDGFPSPLLSGKRRTWKSVVRDFGTCSKDRAKNNLPFCCLSLRDSRYFRGAKGDTCSSAVPKLGLALLILCTAGRAAFTADDGTSTVKELRAIDYGVVGDGKTDDGPAILKLMDRALDQSGPVAVVFPKNRVIVARTGRDRYLFSPLHKKNLVIDGGGSEFRLDGELRFMNIFGCENLQVRNLKVDYLEAVTVAGTIVRVDSASQSIDVRLDQPEQAVRLGGPTGEDGEQAFFGMIHMDACRGTKKVIHYYVEFVKQVAPGVVRVFNPEDQFSWKRYEDRIRIGSTRIGIPVPGVAHRFGPGALIEVFNCRNVELEDIEIWAAPWFSVRIFRNEGLVAMRRVNIRPRPGSGKVLSSCRDAFHAKGNRGELLFEDCVLQGLGDDAFNLSTHCSRIAKIHSASKIEIYQAFPLQYIPMRIGDELAVMSPETNQLIGSSVISRIEEIHREGTATYDNHYRGRAPRLVLTLQSEVLNLARGLVVWDRQTANPRSVIRGCTIHRSCRFQTPVRLERCDVEAYMTFYGAKAEGPGPAWFEIVDSTLKAANVGDTLSTAVGVGGFEGSTPRPQWDVTPENTQLKRLSIENNEIWGALRIRKALDVTIRNNRFVYEGERPVDAAFCRDLHISENTCQR